MSRKKRKNYLILPSYQMRLIGFMALIVLLGSVLHGFFLYQITSKNIQEGFFSAHNRLRSTWEVLRPAIIVTNSLSFLLVVLFLVVVSVFVSHRLVGPLFKVSGHLRKLAAGKLNSPALKLRRGDEGLVLCQSVNELQDEYRRRFEKLFELRKNVENNEMSKDEIINKLDEAIGEIEALEAND